MKPTAGLRRLWSIMSRSGKHCRSLSIVVRFVNPSPRAISSIGPWPETSTCLLWNWVNIRNGLWDITTWSATICEPQCDKSVTSCEKKRYWSATLCRIMWLVCYKIKKQNVIGLLLSVKQTVIGLLQYVKQSVIGQLLSVKQAVIGLLQYVKQVVIGLLHTVE